MGKIISVQELDTVTFGNDNKKIGEVNPFRYRGYYYDMETGFYYLNSRYYDPQVKRFINADAYASTGQGFNGTNMFCYCLNNPVNNADYMGNKAITIRGYSVDSQKWAAATIKYGTIGAMNKLMSNPNLFAVENEDFGFTFSKGMNASVSLGVVGINGQIGIAVDSKGNIAIQGSFSANLGLGTMGASISSYETITNAPSVDYLNEYSFDIGGSFSAVVFGGSEIISIPDKDPNKMYYGITRYGGIGTPGVEFHVGMGYTTTFFKLNIFEVISELFE